MSFTKAAVVAAIATLQAMPEINKQDIL